VIYRLFGTKDERSSHNFKQWFRNSSPQKEIPAENQKGDEPKESNDSDGEIEGSVIPWYAKLRQTAEEMSAQPIAVVEVPAQKGSRHSLVI